MIPKHLGEENQLSTQILPPTTAGINPDQFSDDLFFARDRKPAIWILIIFLLIGFGLRVNQLGTESLGEDEFNKLQTVKEYRTNGLSGKNGEHPFLMKGLQTVSLTAADMLNQVLPTPVSEEAALRFPLALFGTFTALLIYLLISELFGRSIGLISGVLWAVEPMAVSFDRIAKEDSLALFFLMLSSLFLVKSQTRAEQDNPNWLRYVWGAAAGFGALMASKYYPHLLALTGGYYNVFLSLPGKKWSIGKVGWIKFFIVMGVTFLVLNPTIMLPDTWREMLKFSSENRIGHDSYEFMGSLYRNQMSAWLTGIPWTFYYVFIAVKTSTVTLALFLIGLPLMFRRRLGDGRFFILLWAFLWFMPFSVLGGKFTRYFALAEPVILIISAVGLYFLIKWISASLFENARLAALCQLALFGVLIAAPLSNSITAAPHYRLFTNIIGGGTAAAGSYFPHDEFYDTSTRDITAEIASRVGSKANIACETPDLFAYYAKKIGREDLNFVSLSDRTKVNSLGVGDFVVIARGRRYQSNTAYIDFLGSSAEPAAEINIGDVSSALIYKLDDASLAGLKAIAKQ